jgi:hypothetical protein
MEICNVIAGCASGIAVGYLDLLMLMHTAKNALHGGNSGVSRCMRYGFLVRLPIVGVLFYVFLAVLHVGMAGFLSGLAISSVAASLQIMKSQQNSMERTHVGNS